MNHAKINPNHSSTLRSLSDRVLHVAAIGYHHLHYQQQQQLHDHYYYYFIIIIIGSVINN